MCGKGGDSNKLLIWNINQRAGHGKNFYPQIVRNCFHEDYGIVIFNEFYKHTGWEKLFDDSKYAYEVSDNGKGKNEILIAYNKEVYSLVKEKFTWKADYNKMFPDYLEIGLKDAKDNFLMVVGTRILVNTYDYNDEVSVNKEMKNRAGQGSRVADRVDSLIENGCCIIGGGDMNTGRRYNRNEYWTKTIFANMMPKAVEVILPNGVSHEAYKEEKYAGCPDLLFYTKNMDVDVKPYDWNFVKGYKGIYTSGKSTNNIPVNYPDHAQVLASYNL